MPKLSPTISAAIGQAAQGQRVALVTASPRAAHRTRMAIYNATRNMDRPFRVLLFDKTVILDPLPQDPAQLVELS